MEFKPTSSQLNFYTKSSVLDSSIWNQSLIQVFPKIYSYEQLNNAYNCLRRDHEGLRVKFKETADGLVSYIEDCKYINFPYIKVGSDEELLEEARKFVNLPLDFHNMLVNPIIFHTPKKSGVMISAHHIAVDGYCSYVLAEDINRYLQDPEYSAVTQPYAEHIAREEKHKQSKRFLSDREFWKKQFSTNPTCNIFSSQKSVPDFSSMDFNREIPAEIVKKVRVFCVDNEISPTSFFNTVYATYINRMYDVENFTIGVPVLNRTTQAELNTIGLYMHIVPLVINIQSESFFENAKRINDLWFDILRHQKFTQHDIKQMLQEENIPTNTLYDIAADFLEFEPNKEYEIIVPYGNNLTVPVEFHLQSFSEEVCTFRICYQKSYFTEEKIRIMFDSIISLMENAVEHPFENINSIEMISPQEKQKLLYDFNNTKAEYPMDKCVHELFEEIAEKNPDKIAVVACDKTLTYKELNEEANRIAHSLTEKGVGRGDIVAFKLARRSYLISAMLGILKSGAAYLPIDPDYPHERIEYMLEDSGAKHCVTEENIYELLGNLNSYNPDVIVESTDICYCIYTSGSTGNPKAAMICHNNLMNFCNDTPVNNLQHYIARECSSVLACGSIVFDISNFEIFLSLLLNKSVILANEQEVSNANLLAALIQNNRVDCVHCTPTKLRTYFYSKEFSSSFRNVKCVMVGGEQFTKDIYETIRSFSDAKIFNGYGPTETTMGVGFGEVNDDIITIGKPIANTRIYIVDKYMKPVPIGVVGELCITGDCVGAGYLNRPELTEEKFIDNPFGEGKLYKTGDLAYWREDGNIVFVGRNDFQVKIRGLRIELGEIENAISAVEGINMSVVVVRKDDQDRQLLCAFYTGEEKSAKELREEISKSLPKYMIPNIFTHLPEMPMTSSGKTNRNALPEVDLESIETSIEYVAPETKEEAVLTECIEDVLGIERVSILDNFFDIGGDSLKSIELTSRLEIKGYEVQVKTIFASQDIRDLAKELTAKEKAEIKVEYDSVLPATAAQMRVYTAQMMKPDSTHYNVTFAFKVKDVNKEKLEVAVNKLIVRHESLRTHFENINGVIHQVIDKDKKISVEEISEENIHLFTKAFDLSKSPLVHIGCSENTVIVDMHHIVVDGETMPTLFKELNELYMGREITKEAVQYGEFAVQETDTEESEKYWLDIFGEEVPELNLPTDFPRRDTQSFNGNVLYELIDISLHERIKDKCKGLGITPYVFYMTCFNILLSKYSGNEDIVVGMPISGRSSRFLKTVGMFVNTIALRSRPEGQKTVGKLLTEIKDSSIEAIDNQNYPFGDLVKKLNIEVGGRNPLYDVMFAYQSYGMTDITFGDRKAELLPLPTTNAKCDLTFNILPREKDVVFAAEYCTDLYTERTVQKLTDSFRIILEKALDENVLIRDIEAVTEDEKKKVLYDFNDTSVEYSRDKCIHTLLEELAEKTPEKAAVVACDKTLTYKELNEEANRIAHALIEKGVGRGDIVAFRLARRSYLIATMIGILKAGAAYMPIDPDYPHERIEYMLEDSSAKYCVTEENIYELLGNLNSHNPDVIVESTDICYCIYTSGSTGNPKGATICHNNVMNFCAENEINEFQRFVAENCDKILCCGNIAFDISTAEIMIALTFNKTLVLADEAALSSGKKLSNIIKQNEIDCVFSTPTKIYTYLLNDSFSAAFTSVKCVLVAGEQLKVEVLNKLNSYSNITIFNGYGPTETTMGASFGKIIKNDITIGKPISNTHIYIVDKHLNISPIGVTGEICIAGDGVGAGYLGRPELTAEKFIDNPFGEGKLYKTGDLAYWREDGNIVFVGRNDFQVKIRGLRIELGEIENAISAVEGISLAVAVVRKNSEGRQLLCAFYTGEEKSAKELREEISKSLPKYMIPHIFTHLPEMPMTSSGKTNRNALPEVDLDSIETSTEYVAPETKEEAVLIECIEDVLGIKGVSILDNFFNIGGDSIKAIYIVSELEEAGYELHVADIMQKDTLSDIAKAMKSISAKAIYDQNQVNGFIPFSPIMRVFLKENNTIPKDFVHTCIFSADCDEDTARKALDALISHHDILRGTFCDNGIEVHPSNEREAYSFKTITIDDTDKAKEYLKGKSIDDNRLVNVVFCNTEKESLISITVHHFLIDLVSWEVLMKDFQTVVKQLKNKEKISLPYKTASFMLWNDELQKYSETISEESKEYWQNINAKLDNAKPLYSHKENVNEAEEYSLTLDKNISNKLINEANNTYGTRTNEVLLTALGLAACKIADDSVGIIVESHGRAELHKPIAVERTVGWFTSCYPVVIDNNDNVTDELIKTKETLRRIPKNGIDYLLLSQDFHKNADIIFNFYKNSFADEDRQNKLIAFNSNGSVFKDKINVNCIITNAILTVNISVPKCKHKQQISEELGMEFVKQIEKIVDICTTTDTVIKTRSDFSDDELTEIELDELKELFDWTDDDE